MAITKETEQRLQEQYNAQVSAAIQDGHITAMFLCEKGEEKFLCGVVIPDEKALATAHLQIPYSRFLFVDAVGGKFEATPDALSSVLQRFKDYRDRGPWNG